MLENPWAKIVEEVDDLGNKQIFAESDADFLKELSSSEGYKKLDDQDKLNLNFYPLHYIGDIRNAKILVLSLNPGINDEYIKFYTSNDNDSYPQKIKKNLDFSEPSFFEFDFYTDGKEGYWRKLRELFPEEYDEKIKTIKNAGDTSKIDDFFNRNIALVEFFPYHSEKYSKKLRPLVNKVIKKEEYLSTQKFVFGIISERLKKKDVVVIIYRAIDEWMGAVEGLSDYDKVFVTTNPMNPSLKPKKLAKANYSKEILDVIER